MSAETFRSVAEAVLWEMGYMVKVRNQLNPLSYIPIILTLVSVGLIYRARGVQAHPFDLHLPSLVKA